MWTWMAGPITFNPAGVYGVMGIPSSSNYPGARGFGTASWVDLSGNLWLYGGLGLDKNGSYGTLDDTWMYTIATNTWTWMSGSDIQGGGRYERGKAWVDNNGKYWSFGGLNSTTSNHYNDLWYFDTNLMNWNTGLRPNASANSLGSYGSLGVSSPSNDPSARRVYSTWKDGNGNLWLFGGYTMGGISNDLWRYDINANIWTWMHGVNPIGGYGSQCTGSPSNDPPARFENRACWSDACGNFWFFGGRSAVGFYNDLWHFDVSSNQWAWIKGSNSSVLNGNWGTLGVPSPSNTPSGRYGSLSFNGKNHSMWLWGGAYGITSSSGGTPVYNDLWRFDPDTVCANITISCAQIHANFSANVLSGCSPFTAHFSNASQNSSSWYWKFGDGDTSTFQNPNHIYTLPGIYSVNLLANGTTGKDSVIYTNYITVYASPVASFNFQSGDTACQGTAININNTSVNSTSSNWNFGDGSTSLGTSPVHTWSSTGNYSVSCVTKNSTGCTDTSRQIMHIISPPNVSSAFQPNINNGCLPLTVTFTNSSINAMTFSWNFGDGQFSNLMAPTHIYTVAGIYTVHLIASATNKCGTSIDSSIYKTITVLGPVPVVSLFTESPTTGCSPLTVNFTNNSQNSTNYSWTFGDGQASTLVNPTHTYTSGGNFVVTLISTGPNPCGPVSVFSRQSINVIINNVKANFNADTADGCSPLTVKFSDLSTNPNAWLWNFGDGSSSAVQNPSHAFYQGSYSVKLIAFNNTPPCPVSDTANFIVLIKSDTCIATLKPYLLIPNVLTPNNDGDNDYFRITGEGYKTYYLEIYDRWGTKVFLTDELQPSWNGKINGTGNEASEGTYFYILQVLSNQNIQTTYKGFLTLIR